MRTSDKSETCEIPDNYENLDGVVGPPPVENRDEKREYRHEDLEADRREEGHAPPMFERGATHSTGQSSGSEGEGSLTKVTTALPARSVDEESNPRAEEHAESPQSSDSAPAPPSSSTRRQPLKQERAGSRASQCATQLYTVSYLIFFSILGTLARLGIQWLTFYPGAPVVTSVLWANFAGSLLMGFLSEDRRLFRDEWGLGSKDATSQQNLVDEEKAEGDNAKNSHARVKKTIPLYIGLTTGFCGSFTSFSSFQRDVFLALSNNLPASVYHPSADVDGTTSLVTVDRQGGYSFMALLSVIIYTTTLSLAALKFGAHLALAFEPITPTVPFKFTRETLDRIMVLFGWGCWLGAITLAIWPPDRPSGPVSRGDWSKEVWRGEVLFALVFAPVGCLARFWTSLKLNGIVASFPLGTFAVNMFGCAIEAMCYDLQRVPLLDRASPLPGGGIVGCQMLEGISDGFCGCLTTVSTWVAELQGMRRRHAYVYGLSSVGAGLGVMVAVMGSVLWSKGWVAPVCATMRTDF